MRSDPHPSSTAENSRFSMMAVTAIHQRLLNAEARVGAMLGERKRRGVQSGATEITQTHTDTHSQREREREGEAEVLPRLRLKNHLSVKSKAEEGFYSSFIKMSPGCKNAQLQHTAEGTESLMCKMNWKEKQWLKSDPCVNLKVLINSQLQTSDNCMHCTWLNQSASVRRGND